jgi:Ca2+-binding EF-hand superfamily protein
LIDLDHDGTLTMKEVSKYLLGQGMAKEQIQALVNALDTDKSGTISRQEFDEGFGKVVSSLLPKSD